MVAGVGVGRGLDNVVASARACCCCRSSLEKKDDPAGELLAWRGKLPMVMRVVLCGRIAITSGERKGSIGLVLEREKACKPRERERVGCKGR